MNGFIQRQLPPLLAMVVANLILITFIGRAPAWIDEVAYADPSINFVQGKGFVSTAWASQPSDAFWAANAPLHQYLLILWLKIMGVSAQSVRGINLVYATFACIAILAFLNTLGTLKSPLLGIIFVLGFYLGETMVWIHSNGRPDGITLALSAGLLQTFTIEKIRPRIGLLCLYGLLSPIAGLQLVIFVFVAIASIWVFFPDFRRVIYRFSLWYGTSVLMGLILLFGFLYLNKSLTSFINQTFASGFTMTGDLAQVMIYSDQKVFNRLLSRLATMFAYSSSRHDHSTLVLLILWLTLAVIWLRKRQIALKVPLVLAMIFLMIVPPAMVFAGRFPSYYHWMSFVPALAALIVAVEAERSTVLKRGATLMLASAIIVGPVYQKSLKSGLGRNEAILDFVRKYTRYEDVVMGTPAVYYASLATNMRYYCSSYSGGRGLPKMPEHELASLTKIIGDENSLPALRQKVGGSWKIVAGPGPEGLIVLGRQF